MPSTPLDPSHLLAHEDFLKRLARSLLADMHEAKDVVQEAFLAALRQQPSTDGSLRPWLSRVVRNQALLSRRSRGRRARREAAAARSEVEPSAADLLAREEARRQVVDAVVKLPDTYRQVIVLRYMEDMPPRAIAKRLDVPVETVRTRTRRAREQLRTQLDTKAGGQHRAGLALLAPWLMSHRVLGASGVAIKVAAVAFVGLLCAGLALWQPWADDEERVQPQRRASETVSGTAPGLRGREPEVVAEVPVDPAARPTPPPGLLRGRVTVYGGSTEDVRILVWPATPRRAFEADEAPRTDAAVVRQGEADAHGSFAFDDLPQGPYIVEAHKDGFVPGRGVLVSGRGAPVGSLSLTRAGALLPPPHAAALSVRVEDADGAPVVGARVACHYHTGVRPLNETTDRKGVVSFSDIPYARADAGGGPPGRQHDAACGYVTARHNGLVATARFNIWRYLNSHPVGPLVLAPAAVLQGTLVGAGSLEGVHVRATRIVGIAGMTSPRDRTVAVAVETPVAAGGRYRFAHLAPGTYFLTLVSERGLCVDRSHETLGGHVVPVVARPNAPRAPTTPPVPPGTRAPATPRAPGAPPRRKSVDPVQVVVKAASTTLRDLAVIEGATLRGVVRDLQTGRPVRNARVTIELAPGRQMGFREITPGGAPVEFLGWLWPDGLRNALWWQRTTTDARGHYVVSGLAPQSRYFVRVEPHDGWSFDQHFVSTGKAGDLLAVVHDVARAGSAMLEVRSHNIYALRRAGETQDAYAFRPPWSQVGLVEIPGLRPGSWELTSAMGRNDRTSHVLATFDVTEGQRVEVDALQSGNCRVAGRVLSRGRPLEGAQVSIGVQASTVTTNAEGHFEIRFSTHAVQRHLVLAVESPQPGRPRVSIPLSSQWQKQIRASGTFAWEGDIELPDHVLEIHVSDRAGHAVPGAKLEVLGQRAPKEGEPLASFWRGTSGDRGQASIVGLRPDRYHVICTFPDTELKTRMPLTLSEPATELELREPEPGSVRVRVLDEDGATVAKRHVGMLFFDPGFAPRGEGEGRYREGREIRGTKRTDEKGETVVANLPPGLLVASLWVGPHPVYVEVTVHPGEERTGELVAKAP